MRIRKHLLPRNVVDWLCFLLIGVFLPIIFIFEMIVVLPAMHEPGSFWHTFTFAFAMFLIFNVKGNFMACLMLDTSVDFTTTKPPANAVSTGWHHCKKCDRLAPPRSWHCSVCKCCILTRDHHCLFVGCCVGHRNHRYFIMFVTFLFIGSTYALVYNSLFLWVVNARVYLNLLSLLKMLCPMLMAFSGSSWQNMFLVFYNLNILAVVYSVVLLIYHGPGLFKGGVCYEKDQNFPYNKGNWRKNFETVFGKRMHLVWLSPLVKSELPDDGITWSLCVVMPSFHEPFSFMFIMTWLGGLFVVFNILGNLLSCLMVDTSIRTQILTPPLEPPLRKLWRFCAVCETIAPIRSWHCDTCKTCILKRDHHCIFTGNCVGHYNQRFFFMFLIYIIIGCSYSCIYDSIYIWHLHSDVYYNRGTLLSLICPFVGFFYDISWSNLFLLIYELNFISLLYASILMIFQLPNILKGSTTHERMTSKYDLGRRKNLKMVLGKRWLLALVSPFFESKLPHDGVHWESLMRLTNKSR